MSDFLTHQRRGIGRIAPALGLLLLGAWFIGASHQHAGATSDSACSACTVAHAPAISASDASNVVVPAARCERLITAPPTTTPRIWTRAIASPRAPPQG
jgi:hypothetical protein